MRNGKLYSELMAETGIRGRLCDVRHELRAIQNCWAHILPHTAAFDFEGLEASILAAERHVALLTDWLFSCEMEDEK